MRNALRRSRVISFFKPFLHLRGRQKDSTSRSKDILGEGGNASVSVSAPAVQSVSSSGLPRAYLSQLSPPEEDGHRINAANAIAKQKLL